MKLMTSVSKETKHRLYTLRIIEPALYNTVYRLRSETSCRAD